MRRAAPGTTPTTPEQWEVICKDARRQVLDMVNPILARASQEFEVLSVVSVTFDGRSGKLELKFPDLDTGDFLCEIRFELGVNQIGFSHRPTGYVHNGALMFKLMAGANERYITGNWRRWGKDWQETIDNYLTDFFRVGKVFHEQRTAIKTRKPKVEAALKRQPVPADATVEYVVEAGGKGTFREIKRTIRYPKSYTVETYIYDYENEALVLNHVSTSGVLHTIKL